MSNVIKLGEVKKNRPTTKPTDKGDYNFEEVIKQNKQSQARQGHSQRQSQTESQT